MAASSKHRGWLLKHNNGILAAVYDGAQPGTTVLTTNTALDGVLVGTPVTPALAVDSLVISNTVADGDILLAVNNGGNSQAYLWVDASASLLTLYRAGVSALEIGAGMVFNESGADRDFRVETDGLAYAIYADGAKNALVLGSNTDTSSADQLLTISRAARTATANTNYFDLALAPAGAVTVPAGTTAVVATVSIAEPNITATGTATRAATLYIASQPTEGGTANAAILFGAAANIACTTSLAINDDSEDIDFRVETNGMAYAIYTDGGKDALVLGSNTDTSSADQLITVSRAARTATTTVNYFDLALAPAGAVTVPAGTTAIVATMSIAEPNITATGTVTNATTLYIASQPTEGGTTNSAILFGAAANIACTTSLTFNEDSADIDFRFETDGMAYALYTDGGKNALVLGSNTDTSSADQLITISRAARTATAATNYYDLAIIPAGAVTIPTGTTAIVASLYVAEPNITATGTVTASAAVYIAGGASEAAANYALWVDSGNTRLDGDLVMGAGAYDIVLGGNLAAALEIYDQTTKLLVFDTRNTVTVQNIVFTAPGSQTLPDAATSQWRHVSLAAHTVTLVGQTQVTTTNVGAQLWIGAPTYNQSGGAVTVDQVSTLHLQKPVAGASVTITTNDIISTDQSGCHLTAAGIWTDTPSSQTIKQDIAPLDFALMPRLLESIRPVSFKYNDEAIGTTDFGRKHYGIIAEELPDWLRPPGERTKIGLSGSMLGSFNLAAARYLHEANKVLAARVSSLENQLAKRK